MRSDVHLTLALVSYTLGSPSEAIESEDALNCDCISVEEIREDEAAYCGRLEGLLEEWGMTCEDLLAAIEQDPGGFQDWFFAACGRYH